MSMRRDDIAARGDEQKGSDDGDWAGTPAGAPAAKTPRTTTHSAVDEVGAVVVCVALGAMNSVLSKIRADQLQAFDGLACGVMNAVAYMVGYWAIIAWKAVSGTSEARRRLVEDLRFVYVDARRTTEDDDDDPAQSSSTHASAAHDNPWPPLLRGAHRFILVGGLCDEGGQVCGFVAAPYVSLVASALLSQTSSFWNAAFSAAVLGARYTLQECLGVLIALGGAAIELVSLRSSGGENGASSSSAQFAYALLVLASAALPSLSFVLKEKVFRAWAAVRESSSSSSSKGTEQAEAEGPSPRHQDMEPPHPKDDGAPLSSVGRSPRQLDVWVVASAAAVWSLAWAPAVTVVQSVVHRPRGLSLRRYYVETARCFANRVDYSEYIDDDDDTGDARSACRAAWQFWILYMTTNICFNISIYRVVRLTSALTAFVAMKATVPVAIALSLFRWPYVGRGTISFLNGVSLVVILVGVAVFRHGASVKERRVRSTPTATERICCWPLCASSSSAAPRAEPTAAPGFEYHSLQLPPPPDHHHPASGADSEVKRSAATLV